jgi:ribonucleoside-diphosphate reductase alpha chain
MNREAIIAEVYKKSYFLENETYNEWLLRVTKSYVRGDLAERMQKYIKNRWFHPATPISSNAGTTRGLPISCFMTKTFDTKESIFSGLYNKAMLGAGGGGVGADYSSVREVHADINSKGEVKTGESSGIIPFIKAEESLSNAVSQGGVRRFNQAIYLDESHPEIFDFINLKKETGHHNERTPQLSIGVKLDDVFMWAVIHGVNYNLVSPSSKKVIETIKARDLWGHILQSRLQTGYPYLLFIDTCNKYMPIEFKRDGARIETSNLCTETVLPTTEDKDGVCCLGSLNLEFYDDYKDDLQQVVADCSDYLDAVLQDYINQASTMQGHEKAVNGAKDSRDLGLGVMGFHSLLMSKNIPFESPMARGLNISIFSAIKEASDKHQDNINQPCPMSLRVGSKRRNINVTAVAPTGSISTLCGLTSMGIEPIFDNITTKQIKQGVFTIKNKYLVAHLEKIGKNTEEVWKGILDNKGSVQHLDFLDDYTKAVYKTAYEINQQTILELAGDRAKLIDQAQSINLFIPYKPSAQYLSDLHMMAWKLGIKSLYYQRGSSTMEAGTSQVTRQVIEECTSCQ